MQHFHRDQVLHRSIFLISFRFCPLILSFKKLPIRRLTPRRSTRREICFYEATITISGGIRRGEFRQLIRRLGRCRGLSGDIDEVVVFEPVAAEKEWVSHVGAILEIDEDGFGEVLVLEGEFHEDALLAAGGAADGSDLGDGSAHGYPLAIRTDEGEGDRAVFHPNGLCVKGGGSGAGIDATEQSDRGLGDFYRFGRADEAFGFRGGGTLEPSDASHTHHGDEKSSFHGHRKLLRVSETILSEKINLSPQVLRRPGGHFVKMSLPSPDEVDPARN